MFIISLLFSQSPAIDWRTSPVCTPPLALRYWNRFQPPVTLGPRNKRTTVVLCCAKRRCTAPGPSPTERRTRSSQRIALAWQESKRIVLLGKTGAGKSSLANTVFGEKLFRVKISSKSQTIECRAETRSVNSRRYTLIDTPGFFDTNKSEEELKPEILKCLTECAPGPHAFLILLKVERYTDHERAVIKEIQECFSEEVFKYATVVFTHGDQLQEGQTIEQFVHEDEDLMKLVKKCGGRCHVIDNKYWEEKPMNEYRSNKFQVDQLLKTINKMIEENKGGCYTNEMLQAVEEELQIIRRLPGNMSEEESNERAKKNVLHQLSIALAGIGTGAIIGAFFGVKILIKGVLRVLKEAAKAVKTPTLVKKEKVLKLAEGEAGAAGAAVCVGASAVSGACVGGYEGFKAAMKAETVWKAIEMAKEAVTEGGTKLCDMIDD